MILQRLYELAVEKKLVEDPAFELQPIPYRIQLDRDGSYRGIQETRGVVVKAAKKKDAAPKTEPDKGVLLSIPKAHGNTANKGFARYFADTLPRVLAINDDAKSVNSRVTFWQQINRAAEESRDEALRALSTFGRRMAEDEGLRERIKKDLAELEPDSGDRCAFAWLPDGGPAIVEREAVRNWYRAYYARTQNEKATAGPQGFCQITRQTGPIARSHTANIKGIPGGLATGVKLVSNDKVAFESYGLDGAANSSISPDAADAYCRALDDLIAHRVFPGHKTTMRVGEVLFVFWTREASDVDFIFALDNPDDAQRLLESPLRGELSKAADPEKFYCLCLSSNSARAIVRNYLEVPLSEARRNLQTWFDDLRIIDDSQKGQCQPNNRFPLWMLAGTTIRSGDDVSPDLPSLLLQAALKNRPLPESVLAACLQRLRVENSDDDVHTRFRASRMALIKLILNRSPSGGMKMTEAHDTEGPRKSLAYACGGLLAFLSRCQSPKSFGTDAQILEHYFAAASTAPQSVFPLLLRLNRHHIEKVKDEMPGFAVNLEKELEERLLPFRNGQGGFLDFPPLLTLAQQGQFALGFYHQRAQYRLESQQKRAEREAEAAENT